MSKTWPMVKLMEVMGLSDTAVNSTEVSQVNLAGVYSFGRGLFARGPMSPRDTSYKTYNRLITDDFVISQPKAWEGALARVTPEFDGWYLSPVFPTFRTNRDQLEPAFLEWFCKRQTVWNELQRNSRGIGARRETVSAKTFLALQIPLPPLAEQQRIVAKIERLAGKIEEAYKLRQQARNELEKLWKRKATIIFNEVVTNCLHKPLYELVDIRGGGTPSKSNPTYWEGPIPWITPKDMKIREIHDAIDHISKSATKETSAKIIEKEAVLIVVRGMILVHTFPSAVLKVAAAINQDMKALIPDKKLLPDFLCSFFWVFNQKMLALVEKSTHDTRKIRTEKLLDIQIPILSPSEQKIILTKVDNLRAKVDGLKTIQTKTATELDAMLPSILDKAFKGEL